MNMPGFTAEASLFNSDMHYQAITVATVYGGIVQPAGSDVFYPDRLGPFLFSQLFYPSRPVFCLKTVCDDVAPAGQTPRLLCHRELGFLNPVTGSCE
jgi:hypothetical protein